MFKMWRIGMEIGAEWLIICIFMVICTATDIRKKEIPTIIIVLAGILSFGYILFWQRREWIDILYSLIPGMSLLALSLCTRESIGYGDGFVVLVIGICMGLGICTAAVIAGLLISAFCAVILLVCRRVGGKSRLPFIPFLFLGLGVVFLVQKGI